MEITDLGEGLKKISLAGRLDTPGVDQVETRFTASIVPAGNNAVVDLSDVEFIASMGIRMFIAVARGLSAKNGTIALYAPQDLVKEVFDNVSLGDIVPVCATEEEAVAATRA
ncbi:MAG: STAS domain-containing protein [Alphaproteobacteria bacterium]